VLSSGGVPLRGVSSRASLFPQKATDGSVTFGSAAPPRVDPTLDSRGVFPDIGGAVRRPFKIALGIALGFIALGFVAALFPDHSKTTTAAAPTTTPPAAPAAKAGPWKLVVNESSCQEDSSTAYVNCSVGVRNQGDAAGLPVVYAYYQYSDSGQTVDDSRSAVSDPIPAHSLGYVYFSHGYNALKHDVLSVAVTLNENDDRWPYVRVVDPADMNWPLDDGK